MTYAKSFPSPAKLTGACLLGISLIFCGCAQPQQRESAPIVRVMTYNIHHGEGLDAKVDLARIAELIKREGADIVALQEVDKGVARTTRRDFPAELAALTGMSCIFSNNFNHQGGEYGNAVLTKFPVKHSTNRHYQMLRPGEQRGILQVTLEVHGKEIVFLNTHLDYGGDDSERWLNVGEIEALAQQYQGKRIILCGDFNDTPNSRVSQRLGRTFIDTWQEVGKGDGLTIPVTSPRKRIDYIWLSKNNAFEPLRIWVPHSEASDHLPVVTELRFKMNRAASKANSYQFMKGSVLEIDIFIPGSDQPATNDNAKSASIFVKLRHDQWRRAAKQLCSFPCAFRLHPLSSAFIRLHLISARRV